jgi:hypothetical protein
MNATLTPVPSTMFCACGVFASSNAVFVTCNASGSSIGWLGSVGQMLEVSVVGGWLAVVPTCGAVIGAPLIGRSG